MDSEDNMVYMIRLNPHSVEEKIGISLFPLSIKFYDLVQGENFKQFLSINGITEDGQNAIAQHYDVLDEWSTSNHEGDHVKTYYKLLLLVKKKSKND